MKPCVGGSRSTESIGHWTCFPSSCTEYSVHCTLYWAHVLSTLFIVFCSLYIVLYTEYSESFSCRCKNEVHAGQHLIILKPQQIKKTTKLGINITNSCLISLIWEFTFQNIYCQQNVLASTMLCELYVASSELFVSWREYFFESLESLLLLSKSSLTFLSPSRWSATDERT